MALSDKDQRKIFGCAKQRGIDNDMLHSIIYECTKKDSITKLVPKEVQRILDRINGKTSPQAVDKSRMSPRQQELILNLKDELGKNDAWLRGFIKRATYVDQLNWLTKVQASNVIEGLKQAKDKQKKMKQRLLKIVKHGGGKPPLLMA